MTPTCASSGRLCAISQISVDFPDVYPVSDIILNVIHLLYSILFYAKHIGKRAAPLHAFMTVLVSFSSHPQVLLSPNPAKPRGCIMLIAAAAAVVWRAWRNDRCRHYDRIAVAVTIAVTVTVTHTHTIVLAAAFSAETRQ